MILGAARQGVALARWLTKHGATVTLSDKRGEAELASARATLSGLPIKWATGGHPIELLNDADVLALSGGVPLTLPIVAAAMQRGMLLTNDTQIFMEAVPCRTIGITGSAGKTTTTTLVGKMAKAAYGNKVFIGGNIGDPLINYVDEMKSDDLAILEISSFQLEQMTISPNIAAILNITPNHLDRHGTMEAYTAAKARILEFQSDKDVAVLGREDAGAWNLRNKVHGKLFTFSLKELPEDLSGTYLHDGLLSLRDGFAYMPLMLREKIQLRGDHNVSNVLAAFAIGHAVGLPLDAMLTVAEEFHGVAHRLEFVRDFQGVKYYNDTAATTPESAISGINSFAEPIILIAGGADKNLNMTEFAKEILEKTKDVIFFKGEATNKIIAEIKKLKSETEFLVVDSMVKAVEATKDLAEKGDVVLLSTGSASFGVFRDEFDRGNQFKEIVSKLK